MKHIGIIAEYNPFHNGHAYQINRIHHLYPQQKIIVIMSGDFVQRGEPSIFNKYIRTQCALLSGADLIFELPVIFATASAEFFATASVLALSKIGIVDTLCFGAENDNLDDFKTIANLLCEEPEAYKKILQNLLKSGLSFPKARSIAIASFLNRADLEDFLKKPNNILGIEYLKAIQKYHLDLHPMIIKRTSDNYHDINTNNTICSASAIRNHLYQDGFSSTLKHNMPSSSWNYLTKERNSKPLFPKHFYPILQYALWQKQDIYSNYQEIHEDFANTLTHLQSYPVSYELLIDMLSKKNITASHVRHALLNILLDISKEDINLAKQNHYISYLRLLGFRKPASHLLKDMKETSTIPIINKVANASKLLTPQQFTQFNKELHISDLYRHVYEITYNQKLPNEYERSVIITP